MATYIREALTLRTVHDQVSIDPLGRSTDAKGVGGYLENPGGVGG